jgi:hypothetical protein
MKANALIAVAVYAGWAVAGLSGAVILTFLFASIYDPHASGPVGEGLLFLFVFVLLAFVGLTLGFVRASVSWRRRSISRRG